MNRGSHILSLTAAILIISSAMVAQVAPPAPAIPATPAAPAAPAPHASTRHTYVVRNGSGGGYLGVSVRDISHDEAAGLKLPDDSGVEVTVVDQDSPAGKAGVREHDVIRSFNGEKVESRAQLFRMLTETPGGHTASLDMLRNGQPLNVKVQLADRQTFARTVVIPRVEMPDIVIPPINIDMGNMEMVMSTARSGVQVEMLTPQLREFFGVPADQGLLVRSVDKGTPADQAGLRAGDVIVKVQDRPIRSVGDYRMALRDASGKSVSVSILRDKREQSLTIKMPERRESSSAMWNFDFDFPGVEFDPEQLAMLKSNLDGLRVDAQQWKDWQKDFEKSQKEWQKQWKDWEKQWKDNNKDRDFQ
jgi:serine protease Do